MPDVYELGVIESILNTRSVLLLADGRCYTKQEAEGLLPFFRPKPRGGFEPHFCRWENRFKIPSPHLGSAAAAFLTMKTATTGEGVEPPPANEYWARSQLSDTITLHPFSVRKVRKKSGFYLLTCGKFSARPTNMLQQTSSMPWVYIYCSTVYVATPVLR